jgi:hypothetical protein
MKLLPYFCNYLVYHQDKFTAHVTVYSSLVVMTEFGLLIQHESYNYTKSRKYKEQHTVIFTHDRRIVHRGNRSGKLKN